MAHTLHEELKAQTINPPGNDERIAAFSQAMLHLGETSEGNQLRTAIEARRFETASYGANLLLRAVQKQLMQRDATYPNEYDTHQAWSEGLTDILTTPDSKAELYDDLSQRHTQSNVVERYKAFKLTKELLSPVLPPAPRILDVGCSRNHGLKKMMLNLPFTPVRCGVQATDTILPSGLADRLFNSMIAAPASYGPSTGIDITDVRVPENTEWAKSCSFYPSELLSLTAVTEYDYLDAINLRHLDFKQANILQKVDLPKNTFDIITVSTFMYQLSPEERQVAHAALRKLVSHDGVIMYQDFAKPDRTREELMYEKAWFSTMFPYRTIVEFPERAGALYEAFRWSNGRCQQWIPGKDLLKITEMADIA